MHINLSRLPGLRAALVLLAFALSSAAASAAEAYAGYTNMTRDAAHGTQIEYVSARGGAYLWYPGNSIILPGKWKRQGENICFDYGPNTYNPATGSSGGWECAPFKAQWRAIVERMPGDIFGLEHRREVPFKLGRQQTTLEKMLARVSPGSKAPPVEPAMIAPSGTATLSCASIVANAEHTKSDMSLAANIYFHGQFLGKPCVKVDYDRAFELAKRSGTSIKPYLNILRERATIGQQKAIAALEKYGR